MNIHNRLMRAVGRVNASAAAVRKAKFKKEGAIYITAYDLVNDLNDRLMAGHDPAKWYYNSFVDHFGPVTSVERKMDFHAEEGGYLEANGGHTYSRGPRNGEHFKDEWIKLGDERDDETEEDTYFEGSPLKCEVEGIRIAAIPMFPMSAGSSTFGETLYTPVKYTTEDGESETIQFPCHYPEYWKFDMEWGSIKSREIYPGVSIIDAEARKRRDTKDPEAHGTFGLVVDEDGFAKKLAVDVTTLDESIAARVVAYLIIGNDIRDIVANYIEFQNIVAKVPLTVSGEDFSLCIRASYANYVANGYKPNWAADLKEQFPSLDSVGDNVTVGEIIEGDIGEIVDNNDLAALLSGVGKAAGSKFYDAMRARFALKRACVFKSEDVEDVEDVEDAEDATDEIEITEDETMETPEEVKKAMRLVKAWNKFMKEAENGVTSGAQFNMDGANDSEGENPAYSQQDANDLVDEEYETETSGSAIDATGLAGEDMIADEDMTVDSADAVSAVPAVAKSMRRLCKALVRKAEEANPEMTEEQKEEVEDAAVEDLKDPEATTAIAECMKAEGDEELADKLADHAELLEKARKSLFAKNEGSVGAVALPSEEVGVATESVVDKAGEQNDTDMPPSAVDEAGTDKIDVSADLDDHEVAKVEEEPEKENPGYILPEDDVPMQAKTVSDKSEAEDKELAKAYDMLGAKKAMSITDMIAMKRGQRIETADAAEESAEEGSIEVFKPTSAGPRGYRPVELGRGKTMIPPFKH